MGNTNRREETNTSDHERKEDNTSALTPHNSQTGYTIKFNDTKMIATIINAT